MDNVTGNTSTGNVDEHVVKMTFDNKDFEKNADKSISTLEKLKSSMNFEASVKGLDNLEKGVNITADEMDKLNQSVDVIKGKFSKLGIIGVTALQNITNSAINAGKQILKTFTIDPVKSGFNEYELKMNATQTILGSVKGTLKDLNGETLNEADTLDVINKKLNELNQYSDDTIYSFRDMTDNIGKFTNQGVSLDDAVNAMKGISNEAALAGANAEQASHAMYNFSQALSSGYVKLIDWKSIENANMATVGFKDTLIKTAAALGTLKKQGDGYVTTTTNMQGKTSAAFNVQKGFNDSLNHQWLTNKVLNTTLEIYATDVKRMTDAEKEEYETKLKGLGFNEKQIKQFEKIGHEAYAAAMNINTFSKMVDTLKEAVQSQWAQTSEYIFGNLKEARELWTNLEADIEKVVLSNVKLQNSILHDWKLLGGRDLLIKSVRNIGDAIKSIFKPIREAFLAVFKPFDEQGGLGKKLYSATEKFKNFTANLKLTETESKNLNNAFGGLFLVLKRIKQVVGIVIKGFGKLLGLLRPVGDIVLAIAGAIGKAISYVDYALRIAFTTVKTLYDYFIGIDNTVNFIKATVQGAANFVIKAIQAVGNTFAELLGITNKNVGKEAKAQGKLADAILKIVEVLVDAFAWLADAAVAAAKAITIAFGGIGIVLAGYAKQVVGFISGTGIFQRLFAFIEEKLGLTADEAKETGKSIVNTSKSTTAKVASDFSKLSFVDKIRYVAITAMTIIGKAIKAISIEFNTFMTDVRTFGLGEAIIRALHRAWVALSEFFGAVKEGFKEVQLPKGLQNFFGTIGYLAIQAKNGIATFFDYLGSKIPIVKEANNSVKTFTASIKAGFIVDAYGASLNKTGKNAEGTKRQFSGLNNVGKALSDTFHKMADGLKAFIAWVTPARILTAAFASVLIGLSVAMIKLIWNAGSLTHVIARKWVPSMAKLNNSIAAFIKEANRKFFHTATTFREKVMDIAIAVAILTASLVVLSSIDTKSLIKSLIIMAGLMGALALLNTATLAAAKKLDKVALKSYSKLILGFVAIAGSIFLLASALKTISSIGDPIEMIGKMQALVLLFTEFVAVLEVVKLINTKFGKVDGTFALKNVLGVIVFAAALRSLAKSMTFIAQYDWKALWKGLVNMIPVVLGMGALSLALGKVKWYGGLNAIGFAIGLSLIVKPLQKLARIDYTNIIKSLQFLKDVILKMIGLFTFLIIWASITKTGVAAIKTVQEFVSAFGKTIIAVTAAIFILGSMDTTVLAKGTTVVGFIALFLGAAVALAEFGAKNVAGSLMGFQSIMGIALGVGALTGAVLVLGMTDTKTLLKGSAVVSALLLFFGACLKLSSAAKDVKIGPILALTGSIIVLGVEVAFLGSLPFKQMEAGILGMIEIMASFAGLCFVMSKIQVKGMLKQMPTLIAALLAIGVVTGAIIALTLACQAAGIENMITAVASLTGVMYAIIGLCVICSKFKGIVKGAIQGSLAIVIFLGILIGGFVGIAEGIGALGRIDGFWENLNNFIDIMDMLGQAFGKFAGNIVKGIGEGAADGAEKMFAKIKDFITILSGMDPESIKLANDTMKSLAALASQNILGKMDFSKINPKSFDTLFGGMAKGVMSFKKAIDKEGGLSDEDIKSIDNVIKAATKVINLAKKIPNSGGVAGLFAGNNDIEPFFIQVPTIARAMRKCVKALGKGGFTEDDITQITNVVKAATKVINMAKKIPNTGGALSIVVGDNNIFPFFIQVPTIAKAMRKCVKALGKGGFTDDDIDQINNVVKAATKVINMAKKIPNTGGMSGLFMGDNDIWPFFNQVPKISKAMMKCIKIVKGHNGEGDFTWGDVDLVGRLVSAAGKIINMAKKIPNTGGIGAMFTGNKDVVGFFHELPKMGKGMAKMAKAFKRTDLEWVSTASRMVDVVTKFASKITNANLKGTDVSDFAEGIGKSGKPFNKFAKTIGKIDTTKIDIFTTAIYNLCWKLKQFGKGEFMTNIGIGIQSMSKGMKTLAKTSSGWNDASLFGGASKASNVNAMMESVSHISSVSEKMNTQAIDATGKSVDQFGAIVKSLTKAVKDCLKTLDGYYDNFYKKGIKLIKAIKNGMVDNKGKVKSGVRTAIKAGTKWIDSEGKNLFQESGKNLLKGLENGLRDTKELLKIKKAAKDVAKTSHDAHDKKAKIGSPSKLWRKSGVFCLQGLTKGLSDSSESLKLKKTSKSIADTTKDTFEHTLQIHSPSRVFAKDGKNIVQGIINGAKSMIGKLKGGAKEMASVIQNTFIGKFKVGDVHDKITKYFKNRVGGAKDALTKALSGVKITDFSKVGRKQYKMLDEINKQTAALSTQADSGVKDLNVSDGAATGKKGSKKKGSGSSGSSSGGKALANAGGLSEDDIKKGLNAYQKVFYKITPSLDRFNKKRLGKGMKVTADFIAHSFMNPATRRYALTFGKDMADSINKGFSDYAKKHSLKKGTKEYFNALKSYTHKEMIEVNHEIDEVFTRVTKVVGKKGTDLLKASPDLVGKFVKSFKPVQDYASVFTETMQSNFGLSSKVANGKLQSFADYLWINSDEGKENAKNLKASMNDELKIRDKMKKQKEIIDKTDSKEQAVERKRYKTKVESDKKALAAIKKKSGVNSAAYKAKEKIYEKDQKKYKKLQTSKSDAVKKLTKLEDQYEEKHKNTIELIQNEAKGAQKTFKAWKDGIKSAIQDYVKLSNTAFENPLTPFSQHQYSGTKKDFESGNMAKQSAGYTYTQVQSYKNWEKEMEEMRKGTYGFGDDLKKYFENAGYSAADELHKLSFASKDTIKEINGYFKEMSDIEKRNYIEQAKKRFQDVEDWSNNLKKLSDSGILSPAAMKDLADQGVDATKDIVRAMADDKSLQKEYQTYYQKAFGDINGNTPWLSGQTKSLVASVANTWTANDGQIIKAVANTGKIAGDEFAKNIVDSLKTTYGMGNKGSGKISKLLAKAIGGKTFNDVDELKKYVNNKKGPVQKIYKSLTNKSSKKWFKAAINTLIKAYEDDYSKPTTNTAKIITAEKTAPTVVAASEGTKTTKDTLTNENTVLDPKTTTDTIQTTLDTSATATKVTSIDESIKKLIADQNAKLDKLHSDNHSIANILRDTKKEVKNIDSDVRTLKKDMSHLKVVMDTGAVVGAITPGVDKALGKRSAGRR